MLLFRKLRAPCQALFLAAAFSACSASPEAALGTAPDGSPLVEPEANGGAATPTGEADATGNEMLARVIVERSRGADGAESAQALAHFVRLEVGSEGTLALLGLASKPPSAAVVEGEARCRTDFERPDAEPQAVELELLEAGAVDIRLRRGASDGGSVVTLAPHAFPSVSSFASGLVYTTRERTADLLPSDADYDVRISGTVAVPQLELSGKAPKELEQLTLGGVPLGSVRGVATDSPLDVTWQVGAPGDVVTVEFARPDDGGRQLVCAFPDEAGSGTIAPESLAAARGAVRFSVHRHRAVEHRPVGVRAELRFDFEVSHALQVGDAVILDLPTSPDAALEEPALDQGPDAPLPSSGSELAAHPEDGASIGDDGTPRLATP